MKAETRERTQDETGKPLGWEEEEETGKGAPKGILKRAGLVDASLIETSTETVVCLN